MDTAPVLSWELVKTYTLTPFQWLWDAYTWFLGVIFDILSWHLLFVARAINLVFRLQWVDTLNTFQNIGYNMYMPDSRGNRSLHASMLLFAAVIAGITMWTEILRFVRIPEYGFSTGFYTSLGLLLGIVQLAFTARENKKLTAEQASSDAEKPSEEAVPAEETEPDADEKKKSLK